MNDVASLLTVKMMSIASQQTFLEEEPRSWTPSEDFEMG